MRKWFLNVGGLALLLTVASSVPVEGNLTAAPVCAQQDCQPAVELICATDDPNGQTLPHYCQPGVYGVLPGNCGDTGGGGGGGGGGGW